MQSSRLVRLVFATLVVATLAAFFATQQLKTAVPLVLRFITAPGQISPNGDGVGDTARVGFDLHDAATITFQIVNSEGMVVRTLFDDRPLPANSHNRFVWDGRGDGGRRLPDGSYALRVVRKDQGRTVDSLNRVIVDTRPPKVTIASVTPNLIGPGVPGAAGSVRITYRGPLNAAPELRVWHTDVPGPPRIARRFRSAGSRTGVWDGEVRGGAAPDGNYAFTVLVRDKAGNLAQAPAGQRLPTARAARPGTGVEVSRLSVVGPSTPVAAGQTVRLRVGPVAQRVRFALVRIGSAERAVSGVRRAGDLPVRIPRSAHTGLYVVRVRVGGRTAEWPLAVSGGASGGRPLVVLPVSTWQGRNAQDSDRNGFPDTLAAGNTIPVDRPYALGRLPDGLRREAAPLLRFLDAARLPYDLTTDVALAAGRGPSLAAARGVAVAGTEVWVPRRLRDDLRTAVESRGLNVASFGDRSLRRTVALVGDTLRDASPERPDDLFGERTRLERSGQRAPMSRDRDGLGLFAGVDSLFGDFNVFERSLGTPAGATLVTAAGRDRTAPAFVGYRLGRGVVIRTGTPQWTEQLSPDSLGLEVPRITRNIWRELARSR